MPKANPKKGRLHESTFTEQLQRSSDDIRPKKQKQSREAGGEDSADERDVDEGASSDVVDEKELRMVTEAKKALDKQTASREKVSRDGDGSSDDEEYEDDVLEEEEDDGDFDDLVEYEGNDYVGTANLSESEEAVVNRFLHAGQAESRTLADIILEKMNNRDDEDEMTTSQSANGAIPPKVVEVYTSVGNLLAHYRAGKLPKALKMLPHIKDWESVMWITRPESWSPTATYAVTRIFASNLNAKMAQRFYNLILLEKCRDDIRENKKLNYHLYLALKKSLFKPAAFYKGIILPLAQGGDCTLREATIFGSVLAKVSIPGIHSAAALLRLTEMPYSGSTSMFVRILLNKKYSLPRRVVDALVSHFTKFEKETRALPVVWHQSLLVFAQRYKLEVDQTQRARLKALLRIHQHHQMTPEIRRELFNNVPLDPESGMHVE